MKDDQAKSEIFLRASFRSATINFHQSAAALYSLEGRAQSAMYVSVLLYLVLAFASASYKAPVPLPVTRAIEFACISLFVAFAAGVYTLLIKPRTIDFAHLPLALAEEVITDRGIQLDGSFCLSDSYREVAELVLRNSKDALEKKREGLNISYGMLVAGTIFVALLISGMTNDY